MSNLLLIHGAWGGAWEFDDIVESLKQRGHDARAIDLPGHGQRAAPIAEVTQNAYVQAVVEAVQAFGEPVVLIGHSLAGAIISQVAERIPATIERLVYVAAMLPKNGESVLELMQSDEAGELLPKITFSADQSYATVDVEDVKTILLHDVEEIERLEFLAPRFGIDQATEPFMAPAELTEAAFGSVPKTYVRSSLDKVMSPSLQSRMLTHWKVEQVFTLESGHFPLMSMPERLIQVIDEAARVPASAA
jgi:pimeloyl-ACP methyl ester carboxylesterase